MPESLRVTFAGPVLAPAMPADPSAHASLSRRDLVLLAVLTVAWGVNWPVMKMGVVAFPPLLFRTLVLAGGVAVMALWIRARGLSLAVPPGRRGLLVLLAVPNVMVWHVLSVLALAALPSGRAAILGYTMPVWAVVIGWLVYAERPRPIYGVGIVAAFAGAMLLLSSEFAALAGSPLGTLMMLCSAAAWGWGTHLLRRHLTELPTAVLTFWMLAAAIPVALVGTLWFETAAWRWPLAPEWFSIGYNVFVAIAFCHIMWFHLARILPPAASGLSVMLIPVVGVFSGMALLGERPLWQDYVALVLILLALATVVFAPRPPPPRPGDPAA